MHRIAAGVFVTALCLNALTVHAGQFVHMTGHYSDEDLVKGAAPHTLPMTFLYDAKGRLVPTERWPAELSEVRKQAGDGYCCVSEQKPVRKNETPVDCVREIPGTDIAANFKGLMDNSGQPLRITDIPKHQWLLVVYAAQWCAPCQKEATALSQFFSTSAQAGEFAWLTLDVTRMLDAKAAADSAKTARSQMQKR